MRLLLPVLLSLVCGLTSATAASKPANAVPHGNRFLFIVDTSSSMSSLAYASRQAVFDLIYFGIDGQMQEGDTFGLWTFDKKPHTAIYPMQTWQPKQTLEIASRVGRFLRDQPCGHRADMEAVLEKGIVVMQAVKDVNVFIITDGKTPIEGTHLAEALRTACENKASASRKAEKPLIITLAARGGAIVWASVTLPGEAITLPPPPPPPPSVETVEGGDKTSPESVTEPATNTVAAAASASAGAWSTNQVATTRPPIIITNTPKPTQKVIQITPDIGTPPQSAKTPAEETTNRVAAAPDTAPLPTTRTPDASSATDSVPAASEDQVATSSAEPLPQTSMPSPAPVDRPTTSAPASAAPGLLALPTPVSAREKGSPSAVAAVGSPAPQPVTTAPPSKPGNRRHHTLFIIAGVLLAFALTLTLISLRRLRRTYQPSIISQSIENR